jgi:hypothetical protein
MPRARARLFAAPDLQRSEERTVLSLPNPGPRGLDVTMSTTDGITASLSRPSRVHWAAAPAL